MSWSAKWIWKPETPGSEPAGALISAGKSGKVERSLPITAVSLAKRVPASCIPSPESPANRIVTCSICSIAFATTPKGADSAPTYDGGVSLIIALALALFVLPAPWNVAVVAAAAVWELTTALFGLWWSQRHAAKVGAEAMIGREVEGRRACRPLGQSRVRGGSG